MNKNPPLIFDFDEKHQRKKSSKERIGKIFEFIGGNSGLTEEFIYNNQPTRENEKIQVYSGATQKQSFVGFVSPKAKINGKEIKKIDTPAILVVRKGKAGKMILIKEGKISITDDAYILILKKDWVEKVNPNWFVYQYQELFYNLVTSKSDNATFNKEYAEKQSVIIPEVGEQKKQLKKCEFLENILNDITQLKAHIKKILFDSTIIIKDRKSEKLENIFHFVGGNSNLTEDFIYNNQPGTEEEKILILSGATQSTNFMGHLSKRAMPNNKKLKIFNGPCILVGRNGFYAGTMIYIHSGVFVANDHAYVVTLKKEWKEKIDLRWFVYQYQELFFNLVTSKSDNATFNKEYAEKQSVIILDHKKQLKISRVLTKLDDANDALNKLSIQIEDLLRSEIIN